LIPRTWPGLLDDLGNEEVSPDRTVILLVFFVGVRLFSAILLRNCEKLPAIDSPFEVCMRSDKEGPLCEIPALGEVAKEDNFPPVTTWFFCLSTKPVKDVPFFGNPGFCAVAKE